MKRDRRGSGYVLIISLLLTMAVLMPAFIFLYSNSFRQIRSNSRIVANRAGEEGLRNVILTQLYQDQSDFYQEHFQDRESKTRFIETQNWEPRDFLSRNLKMLRMTALINFRNDAFRFGLVVENGLAVDGFSPLDKGVLDGGAYIKGALNLTGGEITISDRPVLVEGDVTGGPNAILLAGTTMYYSGNLNTNGGQFFGNKFTKVPPMDLLPIDLSVYKTKYRSWTNVSAEPIKSATWTFTQSGGECRCSYGPNPDDFWPANKTAFGWPIFVLEGGNLYLRGQCSAKVTVVSYSSVVSNDAGNIFVIDDFGQTPGVTVSTPTSSFAVMATRQITFNKGGTQDVFGYYYAPSIEVANNLSGTTTQVTLHGTLHASVSILPVTPGNTLHILFDPDLAVNVPPGVPERPILLPYVIYQ